MAIDWKVGGNRAGELLEQWGRGALAQDFYARCGAIGGEWNEFEDGGLSEGFFDARMRLAGEIARWAKSHGWTMTWDEQRDLLDAVSRDMIPAHIQ